MSQGFKPPSLAAAAAADDKKGSDILLLDVRKVSTIADYLMIVSVTSPAHMEAVAAEIESRLETLGLRALHRDGARGEPWRALDYGGLLVHLMEPQAREFYQIEKLYHGSPKVRWEKEKGREGGTKAYAAGRI